MHRYLIACLVLSLAGAVRAQHNPGPTTDPTARIATTREAPRPSEKEDKEHEKQTGDELKTTDHSVTIGGERIDYTATAGTLVQRDEAGNAKADMFFVAYVKKPSSQPADTQPASQPDQSATTRPVTFVFNGGPGAASVWLQLGTAGPRKVALDENGLPGPPPYHLIDNPYSWLDATDLVFIDPVGTGYSRPAKGEKAEQFYGVREDIESIGAFIRLWTTRYQRWLSPKFLAGESYGTTRAAGLSRHLLDREGIALNGIVLISSVLDFQTLSPGRGNDLPYALFLPSYCTTARYYKKLPDDLQQMDFAKLVDEVRAFAMGDYRVALGKGSNLSDQEKQSLAEKLARYTGLPLDWILRADLRIQPGRFMKELLASERKVIGRFDSRLSGYVADPLDADPDYDPSLSPFLTAYTAEFNAYVRRELKFESDLPYEVLSGRVQPWNFGPAGHGYLYVADDLRDAILENPSMKVMFCSGWEDLATPFAATEYTIDHMGLAKPLESNIIKDYFEGGHMMYHVPASLKKLHDDITSFVRDNSAKAQREAKNSRSQ